MAKKNSITAINRRLDILARDICKISAGFTCQKCGVVGDSSSVEWAHIEERKKKAIRWSQMNCLALCNGKLNNCHYWFDSNRALSMKWLEDNFPEKHAWLLEEEMGTPRALMRTLDTIDDRLQLEEELKAERATLND